MQRRLNAIIVLAILIVAASYCSAQSVPKPLPRIVVHPGGHYLQTEDGRPFLDLEPNYEDHPYNPWPRWDANTGYFRDYDVRKQLYRSVFAGGTGVTYGHHAIWGFVGERNDAINHADMGWIEAMLRPGARQVGYLRALIESRPFFTRIPDQSLIVGDPGDGNLHAQATRDVAGTYAFVYFPMNDRTVELDLTKLRAKQLKAWWFDPRTGVGTLVGTIDGGAHHTFRTPPFGPDWVLVLDDAVAGYAPPALQNWAETKYELSAQPEHSQWRDYREQT